MSTVGHKPDRVTAEQLLLMPDGPRCELIEGKVRMMTPAGRRHGEIVFNLAGILRPHLRQSGLVSGSAGDPGFILQRDPDTVRAPDVALYRREDDPERPDGFQEGAPDLAMEVVSENDRAKEVEDKARMWLAAGVQEVWVLWPATRTVDIHRPGLKPATYHEGDTIEGGPMLPGFTCAVAEIFE